MSRIITFGSFDIFHYGHLQLLQRAKALGTHLTVGVSSDTLNLKKKGRYPVYIQDHRLAIVGALTCVDSVFVEESLELKREYIIDHKADIMVMGADWQGRFDEFKDVCAVQYLQRTPSISTTATIESIRG